MSIAIKSTTPKASLAAKSISFDPQRDPQRDRLLAIQERERTKALLVKKFAAKYAKDSKVNKVLVNKQVDEFLRENNGEKLSDEAVKQLEQRISEAVRIRATGNTKGGSIQIPANTNVNTLANVDRAANDDALSDDSRRPKSVYIQEQNEDEWAAIARYDTKLYKKEIAQAKQNEKDMKKKIKAELDKQIAYKKQVQRSEAEELRRYVNLVQEQVKQGEEKEKKKMQDMHNKILLQKKSRDQQLLDELNKKKQEKKVEKERDDQLVKRLKQEMDEETRIAAAKRAANLDHMKKVYAENEELKKKMVLEAKIQKDLDVKAQQEYARLVEKQMAEREAEVKEREDRAKKFMSMMADTVVKDQRAQQLEEERKILKNYAEKERRDAEDDKRRVEVLHEKKMDVKNYLTYQLKEKERLRREEKELDKKQALIYKKEAEDFRLSERKQAENIRENIVKNAEIQKKQILSSAEKKRKMNFEEALYNKNILRTIAVQDEKEHFTRKALENTRL